MPSSKHKKFFKWGFEFFKGEFLVDVKSPPSLTHPPIHPVTHPLPHSPLPTPYSLHLEGNNSYGRLKANSY
jgi:hypothetical protein